MEQTIDLLSKAINAYVKEQEALDTTYQIIHKRELKHNYRMLCDLYRNVYNLDKKL